jgi:hypothetical protein
VCSCEQGTPSHLRDARAAATFCEGMLSAWELWKAPGRGAGYDECVEVLVSETFL